jgi:hypothetical protein
MPISKEISDYVRCRVKYETSGLSRTFSLEVECDANGKTVLQFKLHLLYRRIVSFIFSVVF